MAPVITLLASRPTIVSKVCLTAQHRELVDEVLDLWRIVPDHDLDLMRHVHGPADLTSAVLDGIGRIIREDRPDWVLVQGDTTSAMAAALAAFYELVPVAHVEAGLRTWDRANPFPEELNRRIIGAIATTHFAPTPSAVANLLREGVSEETVHLTGNPIVDASREMTRLLRGRVDPVVRGLTVEGTRIVLVTAHRRENQQKGIGDVCRAVLQLRDQHDDVHFIVPTHPNPAVGGQFRSLLGGQDRITVLPALPYPELLWTLRHSYLVLTDSGGIQEEASVFGRPVLVLRETTERMEGIDMGSARLVGTDPGQIVAAASELLADRDAHRAACRALNLYGDGQAARRIVEVLERYPLRRASSSPNPTEHRPALSLASTVRRLAEPTHPSGASAGQDGARLIQQSAMTEVLTSLAEFKLGLRSWLTSSAASPDGGFVGWIDRRTGRAAFEYPEITGYALTYLAGLDDLTDVEHDLGRRAGRWLLKRLANARTAPHELYGKGLEYSFDLAMISAGLQQFGALVGDDELVQAGREVAVRLVSEVEANGWLEPLTRTSATTNRSAWSTRGHAHLLKATQCLMLADRGGVPGARAAAEAVIARGIADLQMGGRFRTHPDEASTMVHPHLYAVEGLWVYAQRTGDEVTAACAQEAAAWVWTQQAPSGAFRRWVVDNSEHAACVGPEQGDVTAQAVRAAALVALPGADVSGALRWLRRSTVEVRGGRAIAYQPGTALAHLNVWATMFTHQAVDVLLGRDLGWDELV